MITRRQSIKLGGVALVAAGLPAARARAADEGALLLGLWRREMNAAFAYAAVIHADPLLALPAAHEVDHARALATQLAAVGLATPRPPEQAQDLDSAAELLAAAGPERDDVLAAAIAVEDGLVDVYRDALPALPDPQVAMTAATILAAHAQHLVALRLASGRGRKYGA